MKHVKWAIPMLLAGSMTAIAAQQPTTPEGAPQQTPGQNSPDTQQDQRNRSPHSTTKQDATVAKPDTKPKPKSGKQRNQQSHGPQRHQPDGQS